MNEQWAWTRTWASLLSLTSVFHPPTWVGSGCFRAGSPRPGAPISSTWERKSSAQLREGLSMCGPQGGQGWRGPELNVSALPFLDAPLSAEGHFRARPLVQTWVGGVLSHGADCKPHSPSTPREQMAQAWAGGRDGDWHLCMCVDF